MGIITGRYAWTTATDCGIRIWNAPVRLPSSTKSWRLDSVNSPPRRGGVAAPKRSEAQTGWSDRPKRFAKLTTPALRSHPSSARRGIQMTMTVSALDEPQDGSDKFVQVSEIVLYRGVNTVNIQLKVVMNENVP